MKRPASGLLAAVMLFAGLGCATGRAGDGSVPAGTELVMAPGSKIAARTSAGEMLVTAGGGLGRCYTWEGATRCLELEPRRSRWHGSLGAYFPGFGYHWRSHNGISRAVVEEGQQHFATVAEATAWIAQRQRWIPVVYRADGLLVGWRKQPDRQQLNVEVWQLYVGGAKPAALPGADDGAITVSAR